MLGPLNYGTNPPYEAPFRDAAGALFDPADIYFSYLVPGQTVPVTWHYQSGVGNVPFGGVTGQINKASAGIYTAIPSSGWPPGRTKVRWACTGSYELSFDDVVVVTPSDLAPPAP